MVHIRQYVTLAPDVVCQVIGEDALLLKLEEEVVFSLNATGARVAELIRTPCVVGQVLSTLATEYDVAVGDIEPDVMNLLGALIDRHLVIASDESEATP